MLIGVTGSARSGKNSVASILAELAGFQTVGFADALREMALGINPLIKEDWEGSPVYYQTLIDLYGYEEAKKHPEVRRFLQRLGTEGGRRVFGENFWVDRAAERIEQLPSAANVAMPDVRFLNESEFITHNGGSLWRTVRTGYNSELGSNSAHASETEMNGIVADYTLTAANLDELWVEVQRVYKLTQMQMGVKI